MILTDSLNRFSASFARKPGLVTEYEERDQIDAVWADALIPARRNPKPTPGPSKEPLDLVIDLFGDLSESQLCNLFLNSYSAINRMLPQESFFVLDERGVREKTVVIYAWDPAIEDNEVDTWRSWRVRFEDAEDAIFGIIGPLEMYEDLFVLHADQFTGEDGIFDYLRASDARATGAFNK
jgi:hypothetical protein